MRLLLSRWVVSALGTAALAGLAWTFGPLWPPLEPALPRLLLVQSLLLAWAGGNALLDWRRRARGRALDAGLTAAAAEEGAAQRDALRQALARFRKAGGRAGLAELPWYAIIGPPGAGKTTALQNAGLRFMGEDAAPLPGVGGTRLCEWWFTRDAVLIDTAGRYTTQDSDAAVDGAGWRSFLHLLRRSRPRQPLNGVIVAIALPEVVAAGAAQRDAHAAAIARRVAELEGAFGLRLPVYALFTKADLVAGFGEFFDDLDAEGRHQVWGETFPLAATGTPAARFAPAFRELAARLAARMPPRLAAEQRAERLVPIAGFPAQFASLEQPLAAFLDAAFARVAMLRGVYFASGTQEGTPFDRLTGGMARAFGLPAPAARRPEAGRAFFLGQLLREVILGEALLVREPPGRRRLRGLARAAGFAAILLLLGGFLGVLAWSQRPAGEQVAAAAAALDGYAAAAAPLLDAPVADGDLRPLAPLLDQARALADAVPEAEVPLGLGQAPKLEAGARAAYRNALTFALLPRLLWQLEAELRGELARPDKLYETTRLYLMLGGAGPLDAAEVHTRLARDWALRMPGEPALVAALLGHLDRLLAEPLPPVPLDGPLVAAARDSLRQVPLAARVYAGLQAAAAALPAWAPARPLGPAGVTIFVRASGRPMTEGIPGLYTAAGLRDAVLPALPAALRRVAGESWVMGRDAAPTPAELQALEREVTALYAADFIRHWDAMLADLEVAPIATLPQAAQAFYILSSPESPLRALLRSATEQVAAANPAIAARYAPLAALAGGDGAALSRSLRLVADLQQQLAKIAALPVGAAIPPGGEDIGNALAADAARQPPPLNRWLSTVAASAQALRTGNARRRIALLFNTPGGPAQLCAAAVARYPFATGGPPLPLEDFARVFGTGGALDGFLNTQLRPYLDTDTLVWRLQPQAASPPLLGAADLAQFQRAAAIRDAFFPAGQALPAFQFTAQPAGAARGATLLIGDTEIAPAAGPARATQVIWPPGGAPVAGVSAPGFAAQESGPWALHRLVARGTLHPGPRPGRQTLTFPAAGGAAFELGLAVANPFAPGLFSGFRCPVIL